MLLDPIQQKKLTDKLNDSSTVAISFDLGFSNQEVNVDTAHFYFPDARKIPLPNTDLFDLKDLRTILRFNGTTWEKWQRFDEQTGKFYKMIFVEEGKPPTVEISGIKMHVTQNGNPKMDTANKIRSLGTVYGNVLDCCFGLGYTAIALAKLPQVPQVVTIERDQNMISLAKENPWSQDVFQSEKIVLRKGDTSQLIGGFDENSFSTILHDPPRFALAPELYEIAFYEHCHRILQNKGKLYHYTGDPNKSRGKGLAEKTLKRLRAAGFRKTKKAYQGVWAQK